MRDILPMLWDIVPIGAILIVHIREFGKLERPQSAP
jgi:hypothetical protein